MADFKDNIFEKCGEPNSELRRCVGDIDFVIVKDFSLLLSRLAEKWWLKVFQIFEVFFFYIDSTNTKR